MPDDLQPSARPPALMVSIACGAVGTVMLLVGLATRSLFFLVGASLAGTLSLVSVLVWRSQLIDAWRERQSRGPE